MFQALALVEVPLAPYLVTILTVFAGCVAVLAGLALLDSERENWLVRGVQRARLGGSRMAGMLRRRHVDVGAYARLLPVAELKREIRVCRRCRLPDLCDRALKSSVPGRTAFAFCPNQRAVERHLHPLARLGP